MRLFLGTIKTVELRSNRDSDENVRMLNAIITSDEDVQSVELIIPSNEDFHPETDDVVLVMEITPSYKVGFLIDDNISPDNSIASGEKEIYSKQNGSKKAKIKLDVSSNIILNDGTDFAVAFTELKSEVDKLRQDLIAHTHPGVATGSGSTGVSSTPFTFNVDNAKVEKVRL